MKPQKALLRKFFPLDKNYVLEEAQLSLEDSLEAFEKGVGLVKYCNQKLDEVEKKVELLVKDKEGKLQLKAFEELPKDGEGDD